jgi:hypothetical protein
MSIVGAFDVHRRQLTFDYLDTVWPPGRCCSLSRAVFSPRLPG